jgi:hypothetical protein
LSGVGSSIRGSSSDLCILCIDPAVAVDILVSSILHAFLDDLELLGQVAHGSGAFDGRATWRTRDNFFAHSSGHSDLVEVSVNNTFSYQGFLERFHGTRSFFVYALFGRHDALIRGLIDLCWTGTSQAAHGHYGHISYEPGYYFESLIDVRSHALSATLLFSAFSLEQPAMNSR